jgi:hypothetical protein
MCDDTTPSPLLLLYGDLQKNATYIINFIYRINYVCYKINSDSHKANQKQEKE